jgi:hypothetical protein
MWLNLWRRWLGRKSSVRGSALRRRPAPCKPRLEALEERTLPTSFSPSVFSDGGPGSLRAAVIDANGDGMDDTIILEAATYQLTVRNSPGQENAAARGDLDLTGAGHTIIIQGQGAALTTINGGVAGAELQDRLFQVFPNVKVVFRDLTLTGGTALDDGTDGRLPFQGAGIGGAILNAGSVQLLDVVVKGNTALGGGGADGTASAGGGPGQGAAGGGIANTSILIVARSTLRNNRALGGLGGDAFNFGEGGRGGPALGGGVFNYRGQVAVVSSTLTDNVAQGGNGGFGPFSPAVGQGGPGADGTGGGLASAAGMVTFSDSTVSENNAKGGQGGGGGGADGGAGGNGFGGGAASDNAQLNFRNSTVARNVAAGGGGGGAPSSSSPGPAGSGHGGGVSALVGPASSYNSTSSLFARNTADSNPDFFGLFNQVDHTLVMNGEGAGGITGGVNGNLVNVDAMLDSLNNNGGPTETIALLPGSPALDAGANPDGLGTDQRGQPRVSNFQADIGAFERFVFQVLQGGNSYTITQGQPLTGAVATFDNGNPASDPTQLAAAINWGDGSTTSGSIRLQGSVTYAVDGSHTYQQAGRYQITVTLSDPSGASSTAQDTVDVTSKPPPPPSPSPTSPPPTAALPTLPQFVARIARKHKRSLLLITDATGAVRLSRTFSARAQVLRQDVNGDGVLDVVLQYRQGRMLRRLAFSGRDLTPLPA